nr:ATP-binding protein [Methyloversatilis thermotolerans]
MSRGLPHSPPASQRLDISRPALAAGLTAIALPGFALCYPQGWPAMLAWGAWCICCGALLSLAGRRWLGAASQPETMHAASPGPGFSDVLQELPLPACVLSLPEGRIKVLNKALAVLADEPPEQLVSRALMDFCLTPQDKFNLTRLLLEARNLDDVEMPLRRHDGAVHWISASARAITLDGQAALLVIAHDVTAQKQAQRSLSASEERFRVLLGSLSEAVVLYDARASVVTSNRQGQACDWLDAAHAGLMRNGREVRLWDEQGHALARDMHPVVRSLADGRALRDLVIGAEDAAGQVRWLNVNTHPLFHAGAARPYALVASYSDLTARIRAERALRASEQRYALALRGMNEGLAEWMAPSDRMYMSPRLSQIMGYDAGGRRVKVREFVSGIHPDDRRAWSAALADHLKGRSDHFEHEIRMRHADGDYRWFLLRGVAQRDAKGRSRRVVGTVADVSVRKRLELIDAAERELLSLIASGTPLEEVMLRLTLLLSELLDDRTRAVVMLFAGEASCRLIAPHLSGGGRAQLQELDGNDALRSALLAGRGLICGDLNEESFAGNSRNALLREGLQAVWAFPLALQDGTVHGGLVVAHERPRRPSRTDEMLLERLVDIARLALERDLSERQLHELNESLERRVAERTALLEQANGELEAFSYSVSHDLRTPLRAINGFAHLLTEHAGAALDEEGRDMLSRIQRGATRMGLLIDDILHFSRVSRIDLAYGDIDLDALVASVVADLIEQYPAAQVDVARLGTARGDAAMLRQVFANLVGNALKFSSRNSQSRVEVFADRTQQPAALCVRDNGVGFDPAYAERLFGVFQRMHGAEEFPGTGVGLAIVKRIVERHGGRVSVDAAPGRGATFRFTLEHYCPPEGKGGAPFRLMNGRDGSMPRTGT